MIDKLKEQLTKMAAAQIENNADVIAKELTERPDGKMSFSIAFKLNATSARVEMEAELSFSTRYKSPESEASFELDDPNQPRLVE